MTTLVHRAVGAHAARTRRLAEAYTQLDRVAAIATEDEARALHTSLWGEFDGWRQQDVRDSRADLVAIDRGEQAEIARVLEDMLPYAELFDAHRRDEEMPATPVLLADIAQPPQQMPRANHRALRRSFNRYQKLIELDGPAVILSNEASQSAQTLRWDWEIRRWPPVFDPGQGFRQTFWLALQSCVIDGRNVGMSEPLSDDDEFTLIEQHEAWEKGGRATELPWCTHPDLPRGDFGSGLYAVTHFELTSPITWAAGEELHQLAARSNDPGWAGALGRLAAAGEAVLSWVEFLHPEDQESGLLLVDPHTFDD